MADPDSPRQRLRFEGLSRLSAADGSCSLRVDLEWYGRHSHGRAEGLETPQGRLRASAEACLAAVAAVAGKRVHLVFVGVKAVKAFDGWVVITRLQAEAAGRPHRLLGCAACEREDALPDTAARSVLDACNRLLEPHLGAP